MPPQAVNKTIVEHLATNPYPEAVEVEVAFFGGTFTALPAKLQESYLQEVQVFLQPGKVGKVRVSTRPDRINVDNIKLLKHYGVWLVELGIQSLDDRVLDMVGRGYQRQEVEKAVTIIQQEGLQFGAQLMPGLPGADRGSDVESARCCSQWGAATARIYPTLVLKGTELELMYQRGEYCSLSLEQAIEVSADMYECFRSHKIPVIRMGLQASIDLETPGVVVAGPWHPAFGELVKSRSWRRRLDQVIASLLPGQKVELAVPAHQLSQARGQHRINLTWLQNKYALEIVIVGSMWLQNEQVIVKNIE